MPDQESTPDEGQKPEAGKKDDADKPESADQPKTFDKEYVSSLRSEAADWRIKAQQATEKLQEYEEANASELEKAQNKATKAEQAKAEAEGKLLRFEVAAEKQIPADALDLLSGSTREELEARADRILDLIKSRTNDKQEPDFDGGAREPAEDTDPESAHNKLVADLLLGGSRT
jgi:hypothetical protein